MPSVDEARASQLFAELREAAVALPVVDAIERLVRHGADLDCYKMNAYRIGKAAGVPAAAALRTFLFAARQGILDLNWDVHCPKCRGLPAYEKHLMGMKNRAHCRLCELDWQVDLADQVEVTFTVNPDLRRIAVEDFKARDFEGMIRYFKEVVDREGREVDGWVVLLPGETGTLTATLAPGTYKLYSGYHAVDMNTQACRVTVPEGPPTGEPQPARATVEPDSSIAPRALAFRPGPVAITIESRWTQREGILLAADKPLANWVSAAHVVAQQDFRDLFGGEFLSDDVRFAIRSITLLFTDIKGSTEMYETLGDSKAYALVQEHFRLMTEVIRAHEGGIVKTIGDAVMAAFPVNAAALRAAVAIQREFTRQAERVQGIQVKLGLHRGPAIAVTSNRTLDYFGRMVNLAARVQGAAGAGEILVTPAVLDDPTADAWLTAEAVARRPRTVALKGISDAYPVIDLAP